jgi:PEP-CTERM motif
MINLTLKRAIAIAVMAGVSAGAYAADGDGGTGSIKSLGPVHFGAPTSFNGTIETGAATFNDIFSFTADTPNTGTGASVVNIPLTIPNGGNFNTVLSTMTLMSAGADNTVGTGDDSKLVSATAGAGESLSLTWDQPITALTYLNVTGITNGSQGGLYSGFIGIAGAVPEPETYAMLLAGLGLMGAVVRRRRKS